MKKILFLFCITSAFSLAAMEDELEGLKELFGDQEEQQEQDELASLMQKTQEVGEGEEEQPTRGILGRTQKTQLLKDIQQDVREVITKDGVGEQFVADCNKATNTVVRQSAEQVIQPILKNQKNEKKWLGKIKKNLEE